MQLKPAKPYSSRWRTGWSPRGISRAAFASLRCSVHITPLLSSHLIWIKLDSGPCPLQFRLRAVEMWTLVQLPGRCRTSCIVWKPQSCWEWFLEWVHGRSHADRPAASRRVHTALHSRTDLETSASSPSESREGELESSNPRLLHTIHVKRLEKTLHR